MGDDVDPGVDPGVDRDAGPDRQRPGRQLPEDDDAASLVPSVVSADPATHAGDVVRRRRARRWAAAWVPRGAGAAQAVALATEAERLAAPVPRPGLWTRLVRGALPLWARYQRSRAGRAYARFGAVGGGELARGSSKERARWVGGGRLRPSGPKKSQERSNTSHSARRAGRPVGECDLPDRRGGRKGPERRTRRVGWTARAGWAR
ncbi:hypothetical protein CAE01nite_24530 [Cellulomonas aerilata]|uniref:Uncharacterized protein n=1 Tax=Cellulomonas aerilata TaxID=515326 RepID=A0A512DE41_9CELL|nr:hypothetical protein CAE01nite_24530 [Cellulomonas aerilata]